MAERFLEHYDLLISTLSPIHIGCGQDYDPTCYIMDGEMCYIFDPIDALQSDEDRQELLNIIEHIQNGEDVRQVQRFFHTRRDRLMPGYRRRVFTGPGIQKFYDEKIGAMGSKNRLHIERMTSLMVEDRPSVPGSSLKGAIRTALLDTLHGGKPLANPREAEEGKSWKELAPLGSTLAQALPSDFSLDPMRLLRFSDITPLQDGESGEVCFAVNRKKNGAVGRGPYQILECLSPMSLERLQGSYSFLDPHQARAKADKLPAESLWWGRVELAERCNRFYREQLHRELEQMASVLSADWVTTVAASLAGGGLRRLLESNQAFLLRIGRHSGAEAVTLNGARRIRIKKKEGHHWMDQPTTIWLAANRDTRQEYDLMPFGWVLVEFNHPGRRPLAETAPELVALAQQFRSRESERLHKSDAQLRQLRQKRQQELEQTAMLARRRAEEEEARQAREKHLSSMSDQVRALVLFQEKIASAIPQPVSGQLWQLAQNLVKESAGWAVEDRQSLVRVIRDVLPGKLKGVAPKKIQELLDRIPA